MAFFTTIHFGTGVPPSRSSWAMCRVRFRALRICHPENSCVNSSALLVAILRSPKANFMKTFPWSSSSVVVLDGLFVLSDCRLDAHAVWIQLKVSLDKALVNCSACPTSLLSSKTCVTRVRFLGKDSTLSMMTTRVAFTAVNVHMANALDETGHRVHRLHFTSASIKTEL